MGGHHNLAFGFVGSQGFRLCCKQWRGFLGRLLWLGWKCRKLPKEGHMVHIPSWDRMEIGWWWSEGSDCGQILHERCCWPMIWDYCRRRSEGMFWLLGLLIRFLCPIEGGMRWKGKGCISRVFQVLEQRRKWIGGLDWIWFYHRDQSRDILCGKRVRQLFWQWWFSL